MNLWGSLIVSGGGTIAPGVCVTFVDTFHQEIAPGMALHKVVPLF